MLRAALEGIQPVGLCQAQRWIKKKTLGGGFKWAWVEIYDPRTLDFILCLVSTIWLWGTLFWPRPYPTVFCFQLHMEWSQVTFRLFGREGAKQNHQMWVRSPWYHQITSYYIILHPEFPRFLWISPWISNYTTLFAGEIMVNPQLRWTPRRHFTDQVRTASAESRQGMEVLDDQRRGESPPVLMILYVYKLSLI